MWCETFFTGFSNFKLVVVDGVVHEEDPGLSEHETNCWGLSFRVGCKDEQWLDEYFSCRGIKQLSSVSPKLSLYGVQTKETVNS